VAASSQQVAAPLTAGSGTSHTFKQQKEWDAAFKDFAQQRLHKTGLHFTLQQTRAEAAPSRRLHARIKSQ